MKQGRLIDADALLEAVKVIGNRPVPDVRTLKDLEQAIVNTYHAILNEITNAPTVQREGWVSVEDRLPDQLEVKIKLIDGSEIYAWYQSDGDYYWNCGGREIFIDESNVTHWQPLPAAPTDTE